MPVPSPDEDEAPGRPASPYARDTVGTISFLMRLRRLGLAGSVLNAFEKVSRETFAPRRFVDLARRDISLPLPCGQIMTAPFTVARMIAALDVMPGHRVLEIGTGSGFAAAVLAGLAGEVVSVERYRTLAIEAAGKLKAEGFSGIRVVHGDGLARLGLGDFDRILVNGRVGTLPAPMLDSLAPTGRIVAISGEEGAATLTVWSRQNAGAPIEARIAAMPLPALVPGLPEIL